ncbi:hypothetical protein LPJ78_000025 [Coemansia sp. RSA 989]|nr:hypothetical protein BX667DRAFT_496847 [Coemansia mojavensis]KAJ1868513.1 hypothetical protein LPJ78_000025 [Coemansia sp. RSA 989]KAJ1876123.1 hypothetical protein LPJ55_000025 [Coemansia sp. RSA 990]KAJ2675893.1 hypothetical protein IWW42_000938 [Coemansia sp. RSA 1085]
MESASESTASGLPRPLRTVSDEFCELQTIVDQFRSQLDMTDGIAGLHPFGPINADQAHAQFTQACSRIRDSLTAYRNTTLSSWAQLLANSTQQPAHPGQQLLVANNVALAATKRAAAAGQELSEMRKITDALHMDLGSCQRKLYAAAGKAISHVQSYGMQSSELLVERLMATAKRLGLACYTDVQGRDGEDKVTTVTLAGGILVIDVDIGTSNNQMKIKISYVSDIEHDQRIDMLMLSRLRAGDIPGFEKLVEQVATLDRLTKEKSPASFIHNTFATASTLTEIQRQEMAALNGDLKQVLRHGSGIALPYMRHIGPSTLYFMPASLIHGLQDQQWASLASNDFSEIADMPQCLWLDFVWEPSSKQHRLLAEKFSKYCLDPEQMSEDSETHKVASYPHPTIHGLEMRFLEPVLPSSLENTDNSGTLPAQTSDLCIPYTLVARLAPELLACALTVRSIMAAVGHKADGSPSMSQVSPRLLEDAPTLERLIHANYNNDNTDELLQARHQINQTSLVVKLESPQIRAWNISRIPINSMHQILDIVPLLRRQAIFNELIASCFTGASNLESELNMSDISTVAVKTLANDPFRIDMCIKIFTDSDNSEFKVQGALLRVSEATGDIVAWTHQGLAISKTSDMLAALSAVSTDSLTTESAHKTLSKVADISTSVPMVAQWLVAHIGSL